MSKNRLGTSLNPYRKDPDSVVDFAIDWSEYLDTDVISTSNWTVESGITEDSSSNTTTVSTIFVSGGTARTKYQLTNRITTGGGRTEDQSIFIYVQEK